MEATKQVPLIEGEVTTPLETTTGYRMPEMVAIAVLRAGLGLLDAVIDMIPHVKVGFAGVSARRGDHPADRVLLQDRRPRRRPTC